MSIFRINSLSTIAFGVYLTICLVRFSFFPANLVVSLLLVFCAAILLINACKCHLNKFFNYSFLPAILIIGIFLSALVTNRWDRVPQWVAFVIMGYCTSFILAYAKIESKFIEIIFVSFAAFFLSHLIIGDPAARVFSHISYNGISVVMIVSCVSLYIARDLASEKLTILPALITYVICSYGIGRGGVISSAFLVIGIALIIFENDRSIKKFVASILAPVIHLSVMALPFIGINGSHYLDNVDLGTINLTFGPSLTTVNLRSLSPEPRLLVLQNYFQNLDFERVVFGVNVCVDPWLGGIDLGYSYHNSFVTLHSRIGIFAFIFYGSLIWALLIYLRHNKLFFLLLIVISLRWFVDDGMFFESFDYLFYFFVLFAHRLIRSDFPGQQGCG